MNLGSVSSEGYATSLIANNSNIVEDLAKQKGTNRQWGLRSSTRTRRNYTQACDAQAQTLFWLNNSTIEPALTSGTVGCQPRSDAFSASPVNAILAPTTPNRKRKKSMSFRSGQSGTVVRKGQMWHGRYYVDIPGKEERRRASVPLGSVSTMKKTEAKRKLRAILQEMG